MSKRIKGMMTPEQLQAIMDKAAPIVKRRTEEANEMVTDIGRQIMADQAEWLDAQMKDLLPPNLYEAGKRGEMESLIGEYMQKHKIRIIFVPDHLVLRIMLGERVHSQFVPKLTVDGEPVDMTPTIPLDPTQN